jgi:tetratricopeptide (TPR) repeat protein
VRQDRESWTLRVQGGLELRDPSGLVQKLGYRSVEALYLALARSESGSLSRQELGEHLWPSHSLEQRQVNLRQALRQLRKALGDEAVRSNRSNCSLAPEFKPWILDDADDLAPLRGRVSAGEALGHLVEWFSGRDVKQMLDVLRVDPGLSLSIPHTHLLEAIDRAGPQVRASDPAILWFDFWKGHATMIDGRLNDAIPYLRNAANRAAVANDWDLLREASRWLGFCEILTGRPEYALELAERAECVSKDRSYHGRYQLQELRGTSLLHTGRDKEALHVLLAIQDLPDVSPVAFGVLEMRRAFYLAICGKHEEALRVARVSLDSTADSRAPNLLYTLTKGCVEATTEPDKAIATLTDLITTSKVMRCHHIEIYACEALALAHHSKGERSDVKQMLTTSRRRRSNLGFRYTRWDQQRLQPLVRNS